MTITVADIWLSLRDFMTPDECNRWLRSPQRLLNDRVPIDLMDTDEGSAKVFAVIARLRNGDFL